MLSNSTDISGYEDNAAVSEYAAAALKWAVGSGIINGARIQRLLPPAARQEPSLLRCSQV
jgi:hypothetical protein